MRSLSKLFFNSSAMMLDQSPLDVMIDNLLFPLSMTRWPNTHPAFSHKNAADIESSITGTACGTVQSHASSYYNEDLESARRSPGASIASQDPPSLSEPFSPSEAFILPYSRVGDVDAHNASVVKLLRGFVKQSRRGTLFPDKLAPARRRGRCFASPQVLEETVMFLDLTIAEDGSKGEMVPFLTRIDVTE